ncbi:hypothetical protein LUZ61_005105 [Rhynchospora tenuis]|uniref:Uncharacterized protein n=1 Tax=Rhynchospora tenuis TaxID=198213 RepID=A0AAD5ZP59_9POAL|nr:hypothetical protein LUZ61_005105 [Rhynchospora tenuis]
MFLNSDSVENNFTPICSTINQLMEGSDWFPGVNSVLAIYQSKGDAWSVAFVVSAYFVVLLLFWCTQLYVRTAPYSAQRWKLKEAVWSLSTFLTAMSSYKVANLMPWPVALVVWGMSAAVSFGAFYEFFIHRKD